jgi:ABC-type polysaccharide/polyol phosphate export permease
MWGTLGWNDIKRRYRRSVLGPFWLTATQALTISCIGILYGFLLKIPLQDYLPFLTLGFLTWGLIAGITTDSCMVFVAGEAFIKQSSIPRSSLVFRLLWRNLLMFLHHIIIYVPVAIVFSVPLSLGMLWALPGLVLICINGCWIALLLGMTCARFRDVTPLVTALTQVLFFITPVMWKPDGMSKGIQLVATLNPVACFMELVRIPLLGKTPDEHVLVIALAITALGCIFTILCFAKYRARIAYWL